MCRACAKSRDGARCSNWTSDQWLWRQMSYYILFSVENSCIFDRFLKWYYQLFLAESAIELFWSPLVRHLSVFPSVCLFVIFSHFQLFIQNHWANFNQTWHKASLGEGYLSLNKWRARPFRRGDNYEIAKIHWRILKIVFSRTTEPISAKFAMKHPWVKGIQVYSNEGPHLFPRGDNSK